MKTKITLWIILVLLILAVGVLAATTRIFRSQSEWVCENGQWVKHGNPTAEPLGGCGTQTPSLAPKSQSPSPAASAAISANIKIDAPISGQSVSLPLIVRGSARVFENVVSLRIKDSDGNILFEGVTMAQSPDAGQFGPFEAAIDFLTIRPKTSGVILDIFWNSPADGTELDKIFIPLKIDISNTTTVKAFFQNPDRGANCDQVIAVDRIIQKTATVARKTLEVLLHGPTFNEANSGYSTNIPMGVIINSLNITDGMAAVDFDETLERNGGGSCAVAGISAQIIQTLKQFPAISNARISINGQTAGILQP